MTDSPWQSVGPDYLVAGRYRLRSKLGGGGMGSVWLARDRLLDREVALKQITSTVGLSAAEADLLRSRAIREGRIAAKLSSAHTIAMYDVALERGEPWLVMEYLPARSIAEALNIADALDPVEVAQIGAQVADALAEAHEAGHRAPRHQARQHPGRRPRARRRAGQDQRFRHRARHRGRAMPTGPA